MKSPISLDNDGLHQYRILKGNVEAQGSRIGCFSFYLLDLDCNHVIQHPEVQAHLAVN